jgi:signal transduction histidine kinase
MEAKNDLIFTFIIATLILLVLVVFIVVFALLFQRRQTQHKLEKASLKAQYEAEILNAENEIQEQTMKDISRELHDNVGQMLTLAKMQLNNLAAESPENKRINNTKEFVQTALTDIRALSKTLNNENVLAEGLSKAIKFDLERMERTGIFNTKLSDNYYGQALDHKKEIMVFRMYQELMQNVMKHAEAKNIQVNLAETKEYFNLELIDDGIGFDFSEKITLKGFGSGAGLSNLVHRATLLGGSLTFDKGDICGTKAKLTIPINTH